jgi:hypothetical protein
MAARYATHPPGSRSPVTKRTLVTKGTLEGAVLAPARPDAG